MTTTIILAFLTGGVGLAAVNRFFDWLANRQKAKADGMAQTQAGEAIIIKNWREFAEEIKKEMNDRMDAARKRHVDELESLKRELKADNQQKMDELKTQHTKEIEYLKRTHQREIDELKGLLLIKDDEIAKLKKQVLELQSNQ